MFGLSTEQLLITLIVGAIAGWLAGQVMRGSGYGLIGDIVVGLVGALVGGWLVRAFQLSINLGNPWLNWGFVAFIGAILLLFVIGLLRPRSLGERVGSIWRRR